MLNRIVYAIVFLFTINIYAQEFVIDARLVYPPVATMQLGPSIFFPESDINRIGIEEGTPVRVTINNENMDLRIYNSFGEKGTVGIHRKYLKNFGIDYKENISVKITLIDSSETNLTPKPIKFYVENYKGDLSEWGGYAFGAPHGDCDMQTGQVVKLVAENYGIPSTAAYGCRLSYRGIWYDCNRPLMKEPKKGNKGVIPERQWNKRAEEKYKVFQDSVWANSNLSYGKRFKLFTSFHGHDLTVKLPSGKRIQRPVIEGIGSGFTKDELRKIKRFYYSTRNNYYENPPDLYFGNLPEDLEYEYKGIKLDFFYSGLGSRTYGSLRSDIAEHILHFETPNSMRLDPKVQPKTAKLLHDIYVFVKDSIFAFNNNSTNVAFQDYTVPENIGAKVNAKGGEFIMGAPNNFGWAAERPQHKVKLSPFKIDIYEVTNKQYCEFLNSALNSDEIKITNGNVYDAKNDKHLLYKPASSSPFSEIEYSNDEFVVVKGKENFPVVFVTYYGAEKYASSRGERLPTEAEWEYAASWDGARKYLFSTSSNVIKEAEANFEDSGDPFENSEVIKSSVVGYYSAASPIGCKDMSGNVWEWCSDNFKYNFYKEFKDTVVSNPKCMETSTMKTIRGGAWNTEPIVTRNTIRLGVNPNAALINLGFRCVKVSNDE